MSERSLLASTAACRSFGFVCACAAAAFGQEAAPSVPAFTRTAGSDDNTLLAGVGKVVITELDVEREWHLRRMQEAELAERPSEEKALQIVREIARDHIWIQRAKEFERYAELVTERDLVEQGLELFRGLWDEPKDPELQNVLRRKAEAFLAQSLLLYSDPSLVRAITPTPQDLRRFYRANPQNFVVRDMVQLAQVLLPRSIHGDQARPLAELIRAACRDSGQTLEAATESVAPGCFKQLDWEELESSGRKREVLEFARSAQIGELSPSYETPATVLLFQMVDRRVGRVVPFAEAETSIRDALRRDGWSQRSLQFFLFEVLPYADFFPSTLFDEELRAIGLQ